MLYEPIVRCQSQTLPGVSFTIRRMSFGQRLEFTKKVRGLGQKLEFHKAGQTIVDKLDAALLNAEIDELYLEWGLVEIHGLRVEGCEASPLSIAKAGPEEFCGEIIEAIKGQCGLSDEEAKN